MYYYLIELYYYYIRPYLMESSQPRCLGFIKEPTNSKFYYLSLIKEQNNTFSIHGLWPQYSPTQYPSYCKEVSFSLDKLQPILPDLNKYWYSTMEKNADFWEHEYKKHGSCVFTEITEYEYFEKALKLYKEAIKANLPQKYYNPENNKCLIPVSIDFKLEGIDTNFEIY